MAVATFDLGWSCGWCLWRRDDVIESGVWRLTNESPHDDVRFLAFRQNLTGLRAKLEACGEVLESVAYEQVDFFPERNGVYAAHVYGGLWGNLLSWCRFYRIAPRGIPVSTIKKHVTGHGSAAKPLVTKRIKELFPAANITDHNEADARAILLTAQNKFPHQPASIPSNARQKKAVGANRG